MLCLNEPTDMLPSTAHSAAHGIFPVSDPRHPPAPEATAAGCETEKHEPEKGESSAQADAVPVDGQFASQTAVANGRSAALFCPICGRQQVETWAALPPAVQLAISLQVSQLGTLLNCRHCRQRALVRQYLAETDDAVTDDIDDLEAEDFENDSSGQDQLAVDQIDIHGWPSDFDADGWDDDSEQR